MESSAFGTSTSQSQTTTITPGSWSDWAASLALRPSTYESGAIFRKAEMLAESAAISTEAAVGLLLWLGSTIMTGYAKIEWPNGIWQPAGLQMSVVELDDVPIDSVVNAFIRMSRELDLDPIHDTVKEGPAGLLAQLEEQRYAGLKREDKLDIKSLAALAEFDTSTLADKSTRNPSHNRALIYPSGRAFLSYLYDTPFFNAIDELFQHGHLNVTGKLSRHSINRINLTSMTPFYQGALVNLTADSKVQNNLHVLLRQMLIFWPTSGIRRHKRQKRVDIALDDIKKTAISGIEMLQAIERCVLPLSELPHAVEDSLLPVDEIGVGIRYTILNREQRIHKIAMAVLFWRLADRGGNFSIEKEDYAIAESILHLHEMGGRLFELAMAKGKTGHEFMRLFISLLDGDNYQSFEADATGHQMSDMTLGTTLNASAEALSRLTELGVIDGEGRLKDAYRLMQGNTIRKHLHRWGV